MPVFMGNLLNSIQNNALAASAGGVLGAIKNASLQTGVDFAYLVKQASVESGLNPAAKAKTSSATGLYQFIESTWLSMVKKHGDKYGLGDLAAQINGNGKVSDKCARKEILALRKNPEISCALAAELANDNKQFLQDNWGGKVGATELYLAHFMGAGGAAAFLKAKDANGAAAGAVLFPDAASANKNIFYDARTGRAKSLDQIYAFFDKKFDGGKGAALPEIAQAALAPETPKDVAAPDYSKEIYSAAFTGGRHRDLGNAGGIRGAFFTSPLANNLIANPVEILMLSQVENPESDRRN